MSQAAIRGIPQLDICGDFQVPDAEIETLVARGLRQSFATSDSAWREIVARVIGARRLGWRRWLKRMLTQGRNAREQMDMRRMGYFRARSADLTRLGFRVVFANRDIPQKVQFNSGPVVALRV